MFREPEIGIGKNEDKRESKGRLRVLQDGGGKGGRRGLFLRYNASAGLVGVKLVITYVKQPTKATKAGRDWRKRRTSGRGTVRELYDNGVSP